jgi:hypothetical protein
MQLIANKEAMHFNVQGRLFFTCFPANSLCGVERVQNSFIENIALNHNKMDPSSVTSNK